MTTLHCTVPLSPSLTCCNAVQCVPQLIELLDMGRYRGIGMPRAKKKKVEEVEEVQEDQGDEPPSPDPPATSALSTPQALPRSCARVPV